MGGSAKKRAEGFACKAGEKKEGGRSEEPKLGKIHWSLVKGYKKRGVPT